MKIFMTLVLPAAMILPCSSAERALPWESQLREMGYHIFYTSSINLIHGIHLSLEQASALRDIAWSVEQTAPRPPSFSGSLTPALEGVRTAYMALEHALLQEEGVSKELEAKVAQARLTESKVIRDSLTGNPQGAGCLQCHREPDARQPAAGLQEPAAHEKRTVVSAHFKGLYGNRGLMLLFRSVDRVKHILRDEQLALTDQFTCCLVPPTDFRNPARVGQAAVSETKLNLLKGVRRIPDAFWPVSRKRILDAVSKGMAAKQPGIADDVRRQELEKVGAILDETRGLDEITFEMEKMRLAEALEPTREKADVSKVDTPEFRAALFLLLPGTSRIYDRLIERIERGEQTHRPQTNLAALAGASSCEDGQCALQDGGNLP